MIFPGFVLDNDDDVPDVVDECPILLAVSGEPSEAVAEVGLTVDHWIPVMHANADLNELPPLPCFSSLSRPSNVADQMSDERKAQIAMGARMLTNWLSEHPCNRSTEEEEVRGGGGRSDGGGGGGGRFGIGGG